MGYRQQSRVYGAHLAATEIPILALSNANLYIRETDIDTKYKCQTIHSLLLDLERIAAQAKPTDSAGEMLKLAEAVRFSGPVTNDFVSNIEKQLQQTTKKLQQAVLEGDITLTQSLTKHAFVLLDERNRRVLTYK